MMFNISFFSLLSMILSIICSIILESEAVVEGENAQPGDFPSIVSLRNATGAHYCGGALVTRKHIVTAAHCLYDDQTLFYNKGRGMLKPENVKVLVGTLSSSQGGDLYEVEEFIEHPEHVIDTVNSWIHDVAVIVLKKEVATENVVPTPISLALPEDNAKGNVAGWGLLSYNINDDPIHQYDYPTDLQKLSITVLDKLTCTKKYGQLPVYQIPVQLINSTFILCGQPIVDGAGLCYRDSGSPLMVDGQFIGHAFATVPCGLGFPDLYIPAAAHQDFIKSAIEAQIIKPTHSFDTIDS